MYCGYGITGGRIQLIPWVYEVYFSHDSTMQHSKVLVQPRDEPLTRDATIRKHISFFNTVRVRSSLCLGHGVIVFWVFVSARVIN